jgi:Na+/melibiose symporter-like transporter
MFSLIGVVIGMAITPLVTRWLDKKKTLIYCSLIALTVPNVFIGLRLLDVPGYPENGSPWVLAIVIAIGFITYTVAPPIFASLNAMFADIVDEHELDTGHRREGIIFAARSFLIKAISSFGIMAGGWVIDWIRFPRGARAGTVPEDVLWNLGLYQTPLPSILVLVGILLYAGYRLDRTRHAEIARQLAQRRATANGAKAA